MEISPAVQPPKVGDPITARWASDLAAAVNSCANPAERTGETATPYGKATQAPGLPMLGEFRAPMPFDARVYNDAGTDKVAVYLPGSSGSAVWQSFVYIDQNCAAPSSSQTVGTATNPWVDYGALPGDGVPLQVAARPRQPRRVGRRPLHESAVGIPPRPAPRRRVNLPRQQPELAHPGRTTVRSRRGQRRRERVEPRRDERHGVGEVSRQLP